MNLLQILLLGLSLGAIYSLIALGFVVIYKGTKVVNLAQGSLLLFGAYVVSLLSPTLGFWLAAVVGIAAGAIAAVVIQFIVGAAKTQDHLVMTIMTIGVDIVAVALLSQQIQANIFGMNDPWGDGLLEIAGASISQARVAAMVTAIVLITIFFLVFRYTTFGIKMRAAASDSETSALMGISQRKVAIASWAIGGGLAVVGGIFLAAYPNIGLDAHSHFLAMNAVPAIIIGGMDSSEGAIFGGLIVGFTQAIVLGNSQFFAAIVGDGFANAAPYVLMILVLLLKPNGLFGAKEVNRV